jgi:hypothetical protein
LIHFSLKNKEMNSKQIDLYNSKQIDLCNIFTNKYFEYILIFCIIYIFNDFTIIKSKFINW